MNIFSFCLSRKASPLFLSDNTARNSTLIWNLLSFCTFNISYHSVLACKVSAEKSAHSLMGISLCVTSCFFLAAFSILSLSLTFDILIIMCLDVGLLGYSCLKIFWLPGSGFLAGFFFGFFFLG